MNKNRHDFFAAMEAQWVELSLSEGLLLPGYSTTPPAAVNIESHFSRNVPLLRPLVSAAMNTVTEHKLAVAMARAGGLGIIHRYLTPEGQAEQVTKVRANLHALIVHPKTILEDQTVEEVENWRRQNDREYQTFPVINNDDRVVGLMTKNDFDHCSNSNQQIRDAMTPLDQLVTALPGTSLEEAYVKMGKKNVLLLIDEDGKLAGMYVFRDVKRNRGGNRDGYNTDTTGNLRVGAAIGTDEASFERARVLARAGTNVVVIDTAHGHTELLLRIVRDLRQASWMNGIDIVAGNVVTGEAAKALVDAGADGIKVGIGPGSICTTRIVSGAGRPQLTAIYDSAKAIEGSGVPVCADGGIKYSGNITVALAAGAHSVMLGSLLAGTEESPGERILVDGKRSVRYLGMGSLEAMMTNPGAADRYKQGGVGKDLLVPEGVPGAVPEKGPVAKVLHQLAGGLRSGMFYLGVADIASLQENARFIRINSEGNRESHPHSVVITNEAPNYRP